MIKKLAYSCGALAAAISYQSFATYVIFYYVDVLKLPVYLAGLGMLIFAFWNAVNDPLFGYLSDSTRSRWGRRIPYLAVGAVPFGLAFSALWWAPFTGLGQVNLLFAYFLAAICLFDGLYSLTVINWSALFPEMFRTLAERAQVNAYRQSIGLVGLLIGIAVPPLIYSVYGWGVMGLVFGVIIVLAILTALAGSFERPEEIVAKPLGLWTALKATLQDRSFLTFVSANLFVQYSFTLILATLPFFAKYVLQADPGGVTSILAAAFLTAIPMLFVWRFLTARWGAKYCFMASMLLLALALLPLFFLTTVGQAVIAAYFIGGALAGFVLIADLLISDIIDEDAARTGTRRSGIFFGMNAFITRFAIALETFSLSTIFILSGYSPYIYTQPKSFAVGLRWLLAGCPSLALLLAFVIMIWYPLTTKRLVVIKEGGK
ncbi:MAG: MFS transporter [Candidatus Margulisiibacteriota bacterium]